MLGNAYNTINKVKFESLCHLNEVLDMKPFDSLLSPFLSGINKQDSPVKKGKVPPVCSKDFESSPSRVQDCSKTSYVWAQARDSC